MSGAEIIVCDHREFDRALVDMYAEYDYNLKIPEWIDWKYRQNPFGEPFLVIARSNGSIAGMQAHIPRRFFAGNREILTVEAVDAFVRPSFRRDGIYQKIWKKARQVVASRNLVLMTFPSTKSKSIGAMRKEGLIPLGSLYTYMKLLRPAALLKGKNLHRCHRVYKNIFEPFSRMNTMPSRSSITIRAIPRFSHSMESSIRTVAGSRSREYLNWKFSDNPMQEYTCIVFSKSGEDIGFAALKFESDTFSLRIHDCAIYRDIPECLESITPYIWDRHPEVGVIFVTELESGPLATELGRNGFVRISSGQMLMLDNVDASEMPLSPRHWLITRGDSDW